LCELLSNYGLETTYKEKIRAEVCNKLAINLATNVLAALTGCVISELTANPLVNSLIITMMAEIKQIFLTYGIERANLPSEAKVYAYITEPGSQRHLPSLAQDFARHQPGEIDLITAPLEMAEIAGIRTPIITSLAKLLQFGQNYALDSSNEHFNILTFEETSGYCLLTDSVYQSQIVDNYKISELVTHLVQINVAAKEPNLKKNVA
jgi:2-dehydropantoate 2-reductase